MVTRNTPGGEFFGALREMDRKINIVGTELLRGTRLDSLENNQETVEVEETVITERRGPRPYLITAKNLITNRSFEGNLRGWDSSNLTATRVPDATGTLSKDVIELTLDSGRNSGTFSFDANL